MVNDLPTIFEVVTGTPKKQTKEKPLVSNHSGNKPKSKVEIVPLCSYAIQLYYRFIVEITNFGLVLAWVY